MNDSAIIAYCRRRPFFLVMLLAFVVVVVKAVIAGMEMQANFSTMGNDDIARMVMVRDWIAGQSWFDTTQYRMVPPEGVSMHWSRYIDAGIAAIIVPASWFVPMQTAEQIGAAVWPTLILIVTLLVIGFATKRLFGTVAACFAVLITLFWPLTADLHARAGNLDHHNVQLLMMVILAFAVVWPVRPVAAGVVGGLAAAFSLSTGLEGLVFIVGAGLVVFGRSAIGQTAQEARLLATFCVTLIIGCFVFWLGLTAPAARGVPVCDQLGTPVLSLIGSAVVASLIPLLLRRWIAGPVAQFAMTAVLTAAGLALAWPLLGPCLAGPYGQLAPEIQEMISTRITEAKPFLVYVQSHTSAALIFMLPVITALIAGALLWWSRREATSAGRRENIVLGQLLIFCLIGAGMVFMQMRTIIMVASVVPVIGGVVLAVLFQGYLQSRDIGKAALMFVIAIAIAAPQLMVDPLVPLLRDKERVRTNTANGDCRQYEELIALNAVPPGVFLVHGNFGPPLIWATHHSSLSGPYHRSGDAMANGSLAFQLEEDAFAARARATGATHVLLCAGRGYGSDFLTALAAGEQTAEWLRAVPLDSETQRLFEVLP